MELQGFKTYRHLRNPKEKELHDRFLNEQINNTHITVDLLVFPPENGHQTSAIDTLTEREKCIMLSTIQWLGSPVGIEWLSRSGFVLSDSNR